MNRQVYQNIYFSEDHFKSGFDEHFGPHNQEAHFHYIAVGKLSRFPQLPIQEAMLAARSIGQSLKTPVLCLSGGLDSEAMALAFLKAGIKFTAAIMNLGEGLNEYDIKIARDFCIKHQIKYEEIHLSAIKILENGDHIDVAEKYRTQSPERALFIMFLQKISGDPVLAGEILRKENSGGKIQLFCPKDRDLAYWRYLVDQSRMGVPYFHYYTPELTFSFMAHTSIADPAKEKTDWSGQHSSFYQHKLQVYREAGFEVENVELRQQKWHGYEGLKKFFDFKNGSTEAYNRAFRMPLESLPVYDQNQILMMDEEDQIAQKILVTD